MPLVVAAAARPDKQALDFAAPSVPSLMLLSAGFLVSTFLEQLGWTWFAAEGLAPRLGVWRASVVTGALWAVLHVIPWLQAGHRTGWVIGQALFSVVFFCLIVQAYLPRRCLPAAVALHASYDIAWVWLPSVGATYDPFPTTLGTAALLAAVHAARQSGSGTEAAAAS